MISFVLIVTKCIWEAATQEAVVGFLHFGLMGTPIVICHAGGALSGILLFACFYLRRKTGNRAHLSV